MSSFQRTSDIPTGGQRDCPDAERFRLLAVGLEKSSEAGGLLGHASGCAHCGRILREAVQDLAVPLTQEEIEFGATSRMADPRRRRAFARQLAKRAKRAGPAEWVRMQNGGACWVASLCAVAAAGFLVVMPPIGEAAATQRLLAQAYHEQRTSDLRLAGAAYAAVTQSRGAGSPRSLPPTLLKAEAQLAVHLRSSPDAPDFLRLWGEAEMIAHRVPPAVKALEKARRLLPEDAQILGDLGAAYTLRGDAEQQAGDYREAIDCLTRSLHFRPGAREVLFNRALVLERAQLFEQAAQTWRSYLSVDSAGEWAAEARSRLGELPMSKK